MIARQSHTAGAADVFVAAGVGAAVALAAAAWEASIALWSCGASAVSLRRRPPCAMCSSSSSFVGLHGSVHLYMSTAGKGDSIEDEYAGRMSFTRDIV